MGSFSGLGIGLSFLFGCVLMGIAAELYYLLWWKKKLSKTNSSSSSNDSNRSSSREIQEFNLLFCWRKPKSCQELTNSVTNQNQNQNHQDLEIGAGSKELGLKCEEGIEAELMRVHNLCGPPRFLFTIKEESREDLESDDGRSRKGSRTRSLSDLVIAAVDGGAASLDSYNHHGINPLFESVPAAVRSSPPPTFKFLRDAEEKLARRRRREEEERKKLQNFMQDSKIEDEKCGSFVKFLSVREQKIHNQAAQVLPLPSPSL